LFTKQALPLIDSHWGLFVCLTNIRKQDIAVGMQWARLQAKPPNRLRTGSVPRFGVRTRQRRIAKSQFQDELKKLW
jgi:hypothetical protein